MRNVVLLTLVIATVVLWSYFYASVFQTLALCGHVCERRPTEGGGGGGSKKKKKSSNDSLALGLGLGLGLGGLLLIGLAMLCLSKKKSSTATRGADVENEMVKTGAAMS